MSLISFLCYKNNKAKPYFLFCYIGFLFAYLTRIEKGVSHDPHFNMRR